jgi:hypothetical protein
MSPAKKRRKYPNPEHIKPVPERELERLEDLKLVAVEPGLYPEIVDG